jgi:hypothetical protein
MKNFGRPIFMVFGAFAVVAGSFFGTLFVLDHWPFKNRDAIRAEDAKSLKLGLEKYRAAHPSYPILGDKPVTDLKGFLVDSGYISSIPDDPLWRTTDNQYRYASDGSSYALLFHLESPAGKIAAGGKCITGVGTNGSGYWGPPPDCPF